jgi:hypothetical protein
LDKNIQFTFEEEVDGALPFLDVLIIRDGDGFQSKVYRKPCNANIILHFNSHHAHKQKVGLIYCLVRRAVKICSLAKDLESELLFLKETFLQHGYPLKLVNKHIEAAKLKFSTPINNIPKNNKPTHFVSFPHMPIIKPSLKQAFRINNIGLGFQPGRKIQTYFANYKDKIQLEKQSNPVYMIDCGDCDKKYVGESSRGIKARIYEHRHALQIADTKYQTVMHAQATGHKINVDSISILKKAKSFGQRMLLESAYISSTNNFNSKLNSKYISDIWKPLLRTEKLHPVAILQNQFGNTAAHTQ